MPVANVDSQWVDGDLVFYDKVSGNEIFRLSSAHAAALMTGAELIAPDITLPTTVAAHDYGAAHADWALSAAEKLATKLTVTNADAGANIVAPAENRVYHVYNNSGQTVTILAAGQTGIAIATGKYAAVVFNGTDYERLTPDQ